MKHNSGFLALIFLSLIMVITFSIFQTPNVGSRGLVVDFWTVPHFLAGATIFFLCSFFISLTENRRDSLQVFSGMEIELTVLVLLVWEVYELVVTPSFWSSTIVNNVVDVSVGLIGLRFGVLVEGWVPLKISNK